MSAEMENLIEQWLEGSLDAEKQSELAARLKKHPQHMQQFVEANIRQQMLGDAVRGELVADEVLGIAPIPSGTKKVTRSVSEDRHTRLADASGYDSSRRSTMRAVAWAASIAASLLIAVGWFLTTNDDVEQVKHVQQVEPFSLVAMVQDADSDLTVGDRLSAGAIEIKSGLVRLLFDDGVEVTLQGPAHYELIAPGKTRLHAGLLTATVPPGAEGFLVDTPSAQVVDLGTAFGIEQHTNGTSRVSVFDGEVEVVNRKDSGKRLLTEGETIELDVEGSLIDAEFSTQQFEKLWPVASGIAGSTGAFQFAPQWPRKLMRLESDTNIFVLPEGYAKRLDQTCPVDMTENSLKKSDVPAGRRVRSFLLQFNPVDPPDQESIGSSEFGSKMRRIEGSITFDRPVIGLIVTSETLNVTDEVFALRRGPIRPFKRGLELRPQRTADFVSLSDDHHTLTLKLAVFDQFSDHVRVIVDASLSDTENQKAITH